jgi:hypothetical protein
MDDDEQVNSDVGPLLLRAIEDQMASTETPEVRREFERLSSLGIAEDEARKMMATVLSFYVTRMQKQQADFDYAGYVAELSRLPEIDFDAPL